MGRSLACKSLFKQGQMCVTFDMKIFFVNFLLKLLKQVVIMGYVYDLSDIDV